MLSNLQTFVKKTVDRIRPSLIEIVAKRMNENDVDALAKRWGYHVKRIEADTAAFTDSKGLSKEEEYWNTKIGHVTVVKKEETMSPSTSSKDNTTSPTIQSSVPQALEAPLEAEAAGSVPVLSAKAPTAVAVSSPIETIATKAEPLKVDIHPIFGELLKDLGYKRIYICRVLDLVSAPVWERQRILRPERAARIAESKVQTGRPLWLSGVITMFFNPITGDCGIIDGQHRAAALMILAQKGKWDDSKRNIAIDVFTVENDDDISALFKEINAAEPVKLVDLPDEGFDFDTKVFLDEAVEQMSSKYADLFKPSARCRPPHVNIDVLRDDIFQAGILTRHKIKSTAQLLRHLEKINSDLEKTVDESKYSKSVIDKARENKFYLGLNKSWLEGQS